MTAEAIADVITIVPAGVQAEVVRLAYLGRRVDSIAQVTRLTRPDVRAIVKAAGFGYTNVRSPVLPPGTRKPEPDDQIALNHFQEDQEDGGEDLGWQDRALCAETDPEAFFPEKGGSTREAKKVCRSCEVRAECLEYALKHDERWGVWGGLSERERRRFKRQAS